MGGTTLLRGARLLDARGERAGWLLLDGDRIACTGDESVAPPSADETVRFDGRTLVPGFVDLHCHGGGGAGFAEGDAYGVRHALETHRAHGTTRTVMSLVSTSRERLGAGLRAIRALAEQDPLVLGSHLEGPFLSPERAGAHAPAALRHPDPDELAEHLAIAGPTLRQVTLAPELPGALDAIARLAAAGVVPAVGHTAADYALTRRAFEAGARLLTHALNGMDGIRNRAPGPAVAAIDDPRVTIELIEDGHHVASPLCRLLFAAAPQRVALVSDAMAAAGAPDGEYPLGDQTVSVRDGVARLVDGSSLAGSTLTLHAAVRQAISDGVAPADAITAATLVPARVLGESRLGLLDDGFAADIVAMDPSWQVTAVWAAGRRLR